MADQNVKLVNRSGSSGHSFAGKSSVESYIYWRNPKSSGIVFSTGLILLLSLAYCSFISVISNICLAILAFFMVFRIYNEFLTFIQKEKETHLCRIEFLSGDILSQEKVHEIIDVVIVHMNACLVELRRLFLVEDIIESSKFALMLWVVRYIGTWFNGLTVVIIVYVSAFTLPKIYENNKIQIDKHLAFVGSKIKYVTKGINGAILPLITRKTQKKEE